MRLKPYTRCATALGVALALSAPAAAANAQIDTTRRDTSDIRIRMRKDMGVTTRESGGEVIAADMARLDSLERAAASYRERLDALEAADAASTTRSTALEARINALSDSLSSTRSEIEALRSELAATNARLTEVDTRLQNLNQRFDRFKHHSLFGNSGFYIGAGTGSNITSGTLDDLGYSNGALNVTVPIGWHKQGNMLGIRTEWSRQRLEGTQVANFTNPDPEVYSGVAMLTLSFPLNTRNNFYLMGGGGFYQFRNFGPNSSLATRFASSQDDSDSETKWGFNAGAGLEFHILGATSLFVQSSWTNVAADEPPAGAAIPGRNLQWMPVVVGLVLR